MKIKLLTDIKYKFGITLKQGEIRDARVVDQRVEVELDAGVWGSISGYDYVRVETPETKIFEFRATWQMTGLITVSATDIVAARKMAFELQPYDQEIVDGSMSVTYVSCGQ